MTTPRPIFVDGLEMPCHQARPGLYVVLMDALGGQGLATASGKALPLARTAHRDIMHPLALEVVPGARYTKTSPPSAGSYWSYRPACLTAQTTPCGPTRRRIDFCDRHWHMLICLLEVIDLC